MILTMSVETLISTILLCSSVNSGEKSDDVKNTIIEIQNNGSVTFIGTSPFIVLKKTLLPNEYTLDNQNPIDYLCMKSKELLMFLTTYKGLNATAQLENTKAGVLCRVYIQNGGYPETWTLENLSVKNATKHQFANVSFPETCYLMETSLLKSQLSSMLSVLKKDTSMYGYLTIGDNHIIAFNPYYTMIQSKSVGMPQDIFTNIRIFYKYLSFMDKTLFGLAEKVYVARNERHLCFYFSDTMIQCYVLYDTKVSNYQTYLNYFKKDHFITVDRDTLTNGAKRAAIMKDDTINVKVSIKEKRVIVNNSKYTQFIPILSDFQMDLYDNLAFKIMPKVFTEALLHKGEDTDVYMYYCPVGENEIIVLSDKTDTWYSLLRIKREQS